MEPWQIQATESFSKYRQEAANQSESGGTKELALLAAGKAVALQELLEHFDCKPEIKKEK